MSQNTTGKNNFDSTYYYIATTLSAQNIDKAIADAGSLLDRSADSLQKIKSLMLLATLNERTGKHTEALKFAVQGEKLAEKTGNKEWQMRISGFLSTTFRELGLIAEGKKYIDVAEKANNSTTNSPLIKTFIHQEKAYYEIEAGNYRNALAEVHQAIDIFEKVPSGKGNSIIIATCYQIAGFCYMNLDSFQKADHYLTTSLKALEKQESELKGFIYQNLGELALKQKKYKEAIKYLEMALGYTTSSDNFNLKLYTYKSLSDYYLSIDDTRNAMSFQSKYRELIEVHSSLTKNVSNGLIEKLDYELEEKTARNYILYAICGALLLLIAFFIAYFIRSRKRERKKYLEYIAKLKAQKISTSANPIAEKNDQDQPTQPDLLPDDIQVSSYTNKKEGASIPKEAEERILKDLSKLEQEKFYLKKDVTLSYVSASLKVNSKYLSIVINKNKDKDFNNYVNELRINYIIDRLQEKSEYLDYKISYLAQEGGFSTHSKFTAAFKSITGISPSAFINNLKKDIHSNS